MKEKRIVYKTVFNIIFNYEIGDVYKSVLVLKSITQSHV